MIAGGLAICLVACAGPASTSSTAAATSTGGEVTRIDDGDTIEVAGADGDITIRLLAINAPDQGECYADESLDHLIDSLKGKRVGLQVFGEDQFGRTLAHVFTGDRHINLEMVEMGLAIASTPDRDDPYRSVILGAEAKAYESGVGLWSTSACGRRGPTAPAVIDPDASEPDPPGADDDVLDTETIAIRNDGDDTIDMSHWILRDESTRHRFTFPDGSSIAAGQNIIIDSALPTWSPGGSPVWNNGGDMALLQLPDGTVVDRWRY